MNEFGETLDEMDVEAFFNIRKWLQEAIEAKGGVITDAGIGAGVADLGFKLNGAPFGVQIKPREIHEGRNPFIPDNQDRFTFASQDELDSALIGYEAGYVG